MMKSVSIRLKDGFIKDAKKLAELSNVDESIVIRQALEKGLAEVKLEIALEKFSEGKISTSEAADIAGLSVGELMDEVAKRGIRQIVSLDDIQGSLQRALKAVR